MAAVFAHYNFIAALAQVRSENISGLVSEEERMVLQVLNASSAADLLSGKMLAHGFQNHSFHTNAGTVWFTAIGERQCDNFVKYYAGSAAAQVQCKLREMLVILNMGASKSKQTGCTYHPEVVSSGTPGSAILRGTRKSSVQCIIFSIKN